MLRFQNQRSFNSKDYTLVSDTAGRFQQKSNGKGVKTRTIFIINLLMKGEKGIAELTNRLQKLHPSYTSADVYQPLRQLAKAGLLYETGSKKFRKYSLGKNAKTRFARACGKAKLRLVKAA